MTFYYAFDDGDSLVRLQDDGGLAYLNPNTGQWVEDNTLIGMVYNGDAEALDLDEAQDLAERVYPRTVLD